MVRIAVISIFMVLLLAGSALAADEDCLYYFYGIECELCEETNEHMNYLQERYPSLKVERFEVHHNRENSKLLQQYYDANDVSEDSQGLPMVLLAGSYFVGQESIKDLLEGRIKDNTDNSCPELGDPVLVGIVGENNPSNVLKLISFERVVGTGLWKSVSLSVISIWMVLLMLLVGMHHKKTIRKSGFLFVLGVIIPYVLFSFGVLPALNASTFLYKMVGIISICFGIIGSLRFFSPQTLSKISEDQKVVLNRIYNSLISHKVILVLGIIVGYLSTTSNSQIVLLMRMLAIEFPGTMMQYAFYYTFIVALPLLILVVILDIVKDRVEKHAVRRGKESEHKVKAWRDYNHRLFHLMISVLVLLSGLLLIFL